jgi:hypothetical protein
MSSDKIYISREEQIYLMEMLEVDSPMEAIEKFTELMVLEGANTTKIEKYIKTIMNRIK